jgi:hypothetical protein
MHAGVAVLCLSEIRCTLVSIAFQPDHLAAPFVACVCTGVAALLALQLKQQFPNTTCWAFAPPGGLMSPALSAAVGDFVTSVVTGKDLVPRLSLVTLEQLRDDIMTSLARCRCVIRGVLVGNMTHQQPPGGCDDCQPH